MQRKVFLTKLRPERRQEYIDAHRGVSSELMGRYRAAGMTSCVVYELGEHLVLIVEAEDYARTAEVLSKDPLDREWQSYVAPMKADGDWQEMHELFVADLLR